MNNEDNEEDNNALIVNEYSHKNRIEQMQILNERNNRIISPEEEFKNNHNYRFFKLFGILFCKIGKTLTFSFDKKTNKPKFCIGPNWYLAILSNILITILIISLYKFLIEINSPLWQKILYFFNGFLIYYFFNRCALVNPGIVQNLKSDDKNSFYCNICEVYYDLNSKVEHCSMCGICVEKMDHHCVWVGKCVGKNNKFSFYAMIGSIGILYSYIIGLILLNYYKLKSKNK